MTRHCRSAYLPQCHKTRSTHTSPLEAASKNIQSLTLVIEAIRHTYQQVQQDHPDKAEIMMQGTLTTTASCRKEGKVATYYHQGEAESILQLMEDWYLRSLFARISPLRNCLGGRPLIFASCLGF